MTDKIIVLVTCGSVKEARRVAGALVQNRLAACANIVQTPIQSIYRWKGNVETAKEQLVLIKTSRKHFGGVQKMIERLHSYDVPEIIALPIVSGSHRYLAWITESVTAERKKS